jgi:hypothetical protein
MTGTKCIQRRKRSPSAGIPELDEIVLTARHEKTHRRMPFNTLDVPSMASKDTFLAALRKGPDAHGRVVTSGGEAVIVGRKTESAYGFAMCRPRGEVVHVRLEILDDSGLVCGRDIGASMVEGECADGGIVGLQDCLEIERQPVPCCKLPTRGTGQYAAALWRPLKATSGK